MGNGAVVVTDLHDGVGKGCRLGGEVYRFGPIADPRRVALGTHADIVGGLGGEIDDRNTGGVFCDTLQEICGEVGRSAAFVTPLETVGGTGPAQRGAIMFNIGDVKTVGGIACRGCGEAYRFAPTAEYRRTALDTHANVVGGSRSETDNHHRVGAA